MTAMVTAALGWVCGRSFTWPHQQAVDKLGPDSRVCSRSAREDAKPRLFGLSGSNMRTRITCGTPSHEFLYCRDKRNEGKVPYGSQVTKGERKRKVPPNRPLGPAGSRCPTMAVFNVDRRAQPVLRLFLHMSLLLVKDGFPTGAIAEHREVHQRKIPIF
ncbi:hypothetical protein BDP81DRAFT_428897 [Colletotrichum phormii]|uniref:Uncharacterized protein n=1 Tax=Colletotrichum phormii TaxID=359342 RepID=A0AAJ0EGJ4_9PEZI|nr:uncharacterized protein BDP81DRAFT_428897 [Colletotrichum phormii]KAK1636025.1 hypothetical protein BDP81DRAFT_428897 [Colletotrichum phormii]